jgi:hypothetical protein
MSTLSALSRNVPSVNAAADAVCSDFAIGTTIALTGGLDPDVLGIRPPVTDVNVPHKSNDGFMEISSLVADRLRRRAFGWTAALMALTVLGVACGCGGKADHYPQAQVATAVGRAGTCEACGKAIDVVTEDQYRKVGASRFVICSDACAPQLTEQMKGQ